MPPGWFDSHCHLHICEEDVAVDVLIEDAGAAGVQTMLTVGIDPRSNLRSIELAERPNVWAAVGIHPNSSSGWNATILGELRSVAGDPNVVAIGESGLDFYRDHATPDDQGRAFSAHIALAKELDKALVIHTRASLPEALDQLAAEGPPPRFVFHCWSGDERDLERALEMDAYVSFAGNVSFKSAEPLRRIVPLVPEDRLLIETDAPYLTPEPHRGKPNSPAKVAHVGAAIARVLEVSDEEIATRTTRNARRAFGLS